MAYGFQETALRECRKLGTTCLADGADLAAIAGEIRLVLAQHLRERLTADERCPLLARRAFAAGFVLRDGRRLRAAGPSFETAVQRLWRAALSFSGLGVQPQGGSGGASTTVIMAVSRLFRNADGEDTTQQVEHALEAILRGYRSGHVPQRRVARELLCAAERHLIRCIARQADVRQQLVKRATTLGLRRHRDQALDAAFEEALIGHLLTSLENAGFALPLDLLPVA